VNARQIADWAACLLVGSASNVDTWVPLVTLEFVGKLGDAVPLACWASGEWSRGFKSPSNTPVAPFSGPSGPVNGVCALPDAVRASYLDCFVRSSDLALDAIPSSTYRYRGEPLGDSSCEIVRPVHARADRVTADRQPLACVRRARTRPGR
jgi:hypothetical protein